MSIDPAAAAIGAQLLEIATRALGSGAAAMPSLTALAPAGAEEVSMQAATAFAAEAEAMLAFNAAAQQELARAGAVVTEIAQMYAQVDGEAAGSLTVGATRIASQAFGAGANLAAGPTSAEALAAAAARTPLLGNLVEGVTATNPSTAVPAAASAASTVLGAGAAPLNSIGQVASMGGATAGPAASSAAPTLASSDDRDGGDHRGDEDPGEQLL
ncbi:PE family protein [Mycobacterium saskatchewanense]|uniref:PE family protein n=1 Tax=Mycobacterium saskatchewanense TaxID=220927 RepID=UPI001E2D2437|nr:PE family protein [Mycobacterium saskatchewanense]